MFLWRSLVKRCYGGAEDVSVAKLGQKMLWWSRRCFCVQASLKDVMVEPRMFLLRRFCQQMFWCS